MDKAPEVKKLTKEFTKKELELKIPEIEALLKPLIERYGVKDVDNFIRSVTSKISKEMDEKTKGDEESKRIKDLEQSLRKKGQIL